MTVEKRSPDLILFILTVALVGIGCLMVFNASYAVAGQVYHNPEYFAVRQMMFAVVGIAFMFLAMNFPYWKLKRKSGILLWIAALALIAVFVPGIGHASRGATRWIMVGSQQIQPSEFAKLCMVIYMAAALSSKKYDIRDFRGGLLPVAVPAILIGVLVVLEDMGTAIVIVATALAMLYMAGARRQHLGIALTIGMLVGFLFVHQKEYRWLRIVAFLDPFKYYHGIGYQVCQSLIALGSGGVFGVGLCESRQKLGFLPASYTDFVYAIVGQELGLIGAGTLALLFLAFAVRGFMIALHTKDEFGRFLAAGISILIATQALLNMYVVTSSVPDTGVPLPFISYGGSSLALNLLCVGVLLSVSRYPKLTSEDYEHESSSNRRRHRRPRVSRA